MYIKVKVFTSSAKDEVKKEKDDTFVVYVREEPVRNMANIRVKQLLASFLGIREGNLHMIRGGRSRSKIFKLENRGQK